MVVKPYQVERNPEAWPFRWEWRQIDPVSGAPVPSKDGIVRTHAGYPTRWLAELAARWATR